MQEDKSLDFHIGYQNTHLSEKEENGTSADSIVDSYGNPTGYGLLPILAYGLPTNFYSSYDVEQEYQRFDLGLSKTWETQKNKFVTMLNYQYSEFDIENTVEGILIPNPYALPAIPIDLVPSVLSSGPPSPDYTPYDSYHRYIVKIEESYYMTKSFSLYASGRYDYFTPNKDATSYGDFSYRFGFSINPYEPLIFKAFYNHINIQPTASVVSYSVEDLDAVDVNMYSAEIRYETQKYTLRVSGGLVDTDNYHELTAAGYANGATLADPYSYIIVGADYKLSKDLHVSFDVSHAFEKYGFGATAPPTNVNVSGSYKYERWNFFAQLGYSPAYTSDFTAENFYTIEGTNIPDVEVAEAFDLTLGVRYHFTDDLSFDLKAYNVFDKASETPYLTGGPMGWVGDTLSVSAPRVQVTMRWVF